MVFVYLRVSPCERVITKQAASASESAHNAPKRRRSLCVCVHMNVNLILIYIPNNDWGYIVHRGCSRSERMLPAIGHFVVWIFPCARSRLLIKFDYFFFYSSVLYILPSAPLLVCVLLLWESLTAICQFLLFFPHYFRIPFARCGRTWRETAPTMQMVIFNYCCLMTHTQRRMLLIFFHLFSHCWSIVNSGNHFFHSQFNHL